jgi:hypothetical protein
MKTSATPTDIRIVDAVDIDVTTIKTMHRFNRDDRFQILALDGDRLVGWWSYNPRRDRGGRWLDSFRTEVAARYRRTGLGVAMWRFGIAKWKPYRIAVTIGSGHGAGFVAALRCELAGRVRLSVSAGDQAHNHRRAFMEIAMRRLAKINAAQDAKSTPQLVEARSA